MDGSKSSNGIGCTANIPVAPTVSVLMPVYNGARYLRASIESVLGQTFTDFEFLIVDDGSTDRTQDIIRGYEDPRIRLVNNDQNTGLAKSLNRGLRLARGGLIARHDADDVSMPFRLETQHRFLVAHPEIALLGAQASLIDQNGHTIFDHTSMPLDSLSIRWQLMFGNPILHPSVMFRRSVVLQDLGGYDEQYQLSEDYDLWSRLAQQYEVANLPDVLIAYRRHVDSTSAGHSPPAELISLNLERFSGFRVIPSEWTTLITSLRVGKAIESERLLNLFDELFNSYCNEQIDSDVDIRLRPYLARLYGQVAYKLAMANRRLDSIRIFVQAVKMDPAILKNGLDYNISVVKYFGRWIGGSAIDGFK